MHSKWEHLFINYSNWVGPENKLVFKFLPGLHLHLQKSPKKSLFETSVCSLSPFGVFIQALITLGIFCRFLVRVSFLEIYNEEVRNLLSKDQTQRLEVKHKTLISSNNILKAVL